MASLLSEDEIQSGLSHLPGWSLHGNEIQTTLTFKDFVETIAFVNRLVEPAEAAGHHPDLTISYNKLVVSLTSHDAGGLTDKDLDMAAIISGIR